MKSFSLKNAIFFVVLKKRPKEALFSAYKKSIVDENL
jgi:hypothetical protein